MSLSNHINPDHFLDMSGNVTLTSEDVVAAWELAYEAMERQLRAVGPHATLYVVFGLQGAGKTTWVEQNAHRFGPDAVFLDGPLPSRTKRTRAVVLAKSMGRKVVAVWLNTPFDVALAQNATRTGLACIREEAIRHVYDQLEPPSIEEGFDQIMEINICQEQA
ncbi:ATP-binding protein [Chitinivorax sp. B]|uniref:ATP-binding protein n=1 Tax=Chitinivorax sp. B TaxID=2502235 RepID=UPI0010F4DC58|nr:ATP-binding protein [Chitinivorax sp. B]